MSLAGKTTHVWNRHCMVLEENADALLVIGIPNLPLETQQRWLGGLYTGIWPRAAFEQRRVAVVSSRLGRKLGQHSGWFDAFRTLVCQLDPERDVLITADGTTADRFINRAAKLFGLRHFPIVIGEQSAFRQLARFRDGTTTDRIEISTPLFESAGIDLPVGDRLIATLADHVRALSVTGGSQTHRLLSERLADSGFPPATVHVTSESNVANELADAGAALRILIPSDTPQVDVVTPPARRAMTKPPFDDYLLHWTRRPDGTWPDEEVDDYLDGLILGVEAGDRTAFATLARIVETRKLMATSHLIRGNYPMVCLSDVPLEKLASRRTYRKHLRRWDYEPYGIGVRKNRLLQLGTRPAVYGEATEFEQMSEADRPYFQLQATADAKTQWTDEAEWRHAGDLNLNELGPDLFVFVPSHDEAAAISRRCDWPIVVLEPSSD